LEPEPGAESENNVIATELAQTIESLNLSINQSELEDLFILMMKAMKNMP